MVWCLKYRKNKERSLKEMQELLTFGEKNIKTIAESWINSTRSKKSSKGV